MSDYHVAMRVRRGKIYEEMDKWGISSCLSLSKKAGVTYRDLLDVVNFKASPLTKGGRWRKVAVGISRFFGYRPKDMFPSHLDVEMPTNEITGYADHKQIESPDCNLLGEPIKDDREAKIKIVEKELRGFPLREQHVIAERFFREKSRSAIGRELGITRSRVQQIEVQVLKELKERSNHQLELGA